MLLIFRRRFFVAILLCQSLKFVFSKEEVLSVYSQKLFDGSDFQSGALKAEGNAAHVTQLCFGVRSI